MGEGKDGTAGAFAINRADGQLTEFNTVPSGGAGPTYVSVHPSGRFLLVANYFGGSVAVLPMLADGRLGRRPTSKDAARGAGKAANAPPGSFAFSGHDRTHAHMIQADPRAASSCMSTWASIGSSSGNSTTEPACLRRTIPEVSLPPGDGPRHFVPSQRPLALLDPGGRLEHRAVRLRRAMGG